ncbi:hypothetical protein Pla52o_17180 [Novipirellula galeiformis]|uniref:DUF4142 domain-containing protein n=1 Tax=Novipirellula galeiformis TaxID=2528004 RepID=A0A5C6CP88_9BACT|nr:DUF4142 domain-containing protein [Novipirellula galeiformis]TWU25417.1 hypothetical protein Pla52o_17180 [Novipirellula galeiformis]
MSKLRFAAAVLSIAVIPGLSNVQGQTTSDQPIVKPAPPAVEPGQPPTSPGESTDQPKGAQTDQDDRYEARRVSASAQKQQQGVTIKQALVQRLIKVNDAEIELAKLAQQKSDNDELKQFAQMIVQDHQALNQTLQQHAGHSASTRSHNAEADASTRNQPRTSEDRKGNAQAKQQDRWADAQSNRVPMEFCQIGEQACDFALKMTKDMLNQYEGQDFNMAYLGQQTVAHINLLSELKAIESAGPQELQPIVQQAATKVQAHLEQAKQLAKKLENDRKSRS